MCLLVAYKKGGERKRFNPLTGARYNRLQTHDIDVDDQDGSKLVVPPALNRHLPGSSRGRNGFFRRGDEGSRWKGKGRSDSPYQKPTKDQNTKVVDNAPKTKDKP